MSDDPWGANTPPAVDPLPPLPSELAALTALVAEGRPFRLPPGRKLPGTADLPEMQALTAQGWSMVGGHPETWLLPVVWPPEHRCWLPDRYPHVRVGFAGERSWIEPLPADNFQIIETEVAEDAAAAGVPPRPAGRLWLLRSPWPSLTAEMVFAVLRQWPDAREPWERPSILVAAAREVLRWSGQQVWDFWAGPQADAAKGWRLAGTPPAQFSELALAGLGPEQTARLMAPIDGGGAGLTEPEAVAWVRIVICPTPAEAVAAIIGWRLLGLPVEPRPDIAMFLREMEPSQAAPWLADGFTIGDVSLLYGLVERGAAGRWRARGYPAQRVRELLLADRSLTPDEAAAFAAAGIDADEEIRWVEAGFSAHDARGWRDVDVLPNEARVWRSTGLGPEDARRQKAAGGGVLPDGVELGWLASGEAPGRGDIRYGATDPPGTRGQLAAENATIQGLLDGE